MKLTIKSLTGTNFTLEAEPTDTIGSVKSKIESAQGHPASAQKLIFSGKILTDDQTIEKCNIKSEKDFLVCMVSKPKAPKPEAAAPSTPAPASSSASVATPSAPAPAAAAAAPATPATPSPASSAPAPAPAASAPASETTAGAQSGPSSSFLSGAALESAIANMEEMGFAKPEIQRAMRASFNNPDRAIEYLMTGIPEGLGDAPAAPASGGQAAAATPASTTSSAPASGGAPAPAAAAAAPGAAPRSGNLFEAAAAAAQGGGGGAAGAAGAAGGRAGRAGGIPGVGEDAQGGQTIDLGNPQMVEQLRTLLAQNPAALQPLIQAMAQSNPQLAQAMAQDPEGVLEMLAQGAEGGAGEGEALPSFEELSEEDRTAVQNISAMGIPVDQAIECYLMCGRNVEMAVQYYFDNPGDFQ